MKKVKEKKAPELNERQKAFCEYYIQSLNATEAAIKAGYSEKTAGSMGAENLKKPQILKYIDEIMSQKHDERIADGEEVLKYLTDVMRGNIKDQFDMEASIQDRTRAAELLGKRYRLFVDKQEISGNLEAVTIVNDIPKPDAG